MTGAQRSAPARRFPWERALREAVDVDATAKLVGFALATWSTTETGGDARPGIERLVVATSKSEPTVHRALRRLEEAGYIQAESRRGRPRGWATVYQLCLPVDPLSPTTGNHPRQGITGDNDSLSPAPRLPVTGDTPQAQYLLKTDSAAAREVVVDEPDPVDGLTEQQTAAALSLVARFEPAVTRADAADCIRALASARKGPPENYSSYTARFDADDVLQRAAQHRSSPLGSQTTFGGRGDIDWTAAVARANAIDAAAEAGRCRECDELERDCRARAAINGHTYEPRLTSEAVMTP